MDGSQCYVRLLYIIDMVLSREISQHLIEKWTRENEPLEISLWLEKEKDHKGKKISLKSKKCIKFKGGINKSTYRPIICFIERIVFFIERRYYYLLELIWKNTFISVEIKHFCDDCEVSTRPFFSSQTFCAFESDLSCFDSALLAFMS